MELLQNSSNSLAANSDDIPDIDQNHSRTTGYKRPVLIRQILDSKQLKLGATRKIYNWWQRQEKHPVLKENFEILEHLRYAGNLYLIERLQDNSFKFTVSGEGVSHVTGKNMHGLIISDTAEKNPNETDYSDLIRYLKTVLDTNLAYSCSGKSLLTGPVKFSFESIDCPLADDAGNMRYILGAIKQI